MCYQRGALWIKLSGTRLETLLESSAVPRTQRMLIYGGVCELLGMASEWKWIQAVSTTFENREKLWHQSIKLSWIHVFSVEFYWSISTLIVWRIRMPWNINSKNWTVGRHRRNGPNNIPRGNNAWITSYPWASRLMAAEFLSHLLTILVLSRRFVHMAWLFSLIAWDRKWGSVNFSLLCKLDSSPRQMSLREEFVLSFKAFIENFGTSSPSSWATTTIQLEE